MILQSSLVNPVVIHMVFFLECGWGKRSCLLRCSRVRCLAGCFHVSARLDKLRARAHESAFGIGEHELQFLDLGLLAFACVLQLSNTVLWVHCPCISSCTFLHRLHGVSLLPGTSARLRARDCKTFVMWKNERLRMPHMSVSFGDCFVSLC